MNIKQMGIDEAFERFKRGMEVGILQPVAPEPKGLGDYELMTLKKAFRWMCVLQDYARKRRD